MTQDDPAREPLGVRHTEPGTFEQVALLERAIGYLLGCLQGVSAADLDRPTPCRDWDLALLLVHLSDSLSALRDAADLGFVELAAADGEPDGPIDLPQLVRLRAGEALGAWVMEEGGEMAVVGGCRVSTALVSAAGSLEVAVHGWDIATACGLDRPLPPALAGELLDLAPGLITTADRPGRFAAPQPVDPTAPVDVRLLSFVGRRP